MFEIKRNIKIEIIAISLIALFAVSIASTTSMTSAQVGIAQPEKTSGYISVAPKLLGVGQNATVNTWVMPIPVNYLYQANFTGYTGITVTFTRPDGTKDTFMPIDGTHTLAAGHTEATGSLFFFYAPNMAGNWSVTMSMPAQNITATSGTVQYTECTSNTAYFTVQTDPVLGGLLNGYPWAELPNSNAYWTYPINSNNREWSAISGDWLQWQSATGTVQGSFFGVTSNLWQPYGTGPNSSHIVWKLPTANGGLIGGEYGGLSYAQSTINAINGVVILEGKVYQNIPNAGQFQCIDLATGRVLYKASGSVTCGYHFPGNAMDQAASFGQGNDIELQSSHGSDYTPYIFQSNGSIWNFYDPFTGALVRSIVNSSSARLFDGTNWAYGTSGGNLTAWNMTRVTGNNWPTGVTWTIRLPTSLLGSTPSIFALSSDGSTIVCKTTNQYFGFSAKDGSSLWNLTLAYPAVMNCQFYAYGVDDFFAFGSSDTTFHCYSMLTGKELWTSPSFSDSPWASTWTVYASETNDDKNLYLMFPDGTISALSLETGKQVWRSAPMPSTEYTNNVVPYVSGMIMVGGNIYAYAGYSIGYQINPIPRNQMLVCVNTTSGNTTWTLNSGGYPLAAANGYVMTLGTFDGVDYCIGKGQTSTTVSTPQTAITAGTTVTISGSVLDKSAAQPNTAAISDADMSVWMDYLHMQNSTLLNNPPQCTGVHVTLTAVDPNGNAVPVGTTTSNYQGNYGFQWTPTTPGLYIVYATFGGSNAYYSSSASAYATVSNAPNSPAPTTIEQLSVSNSDMLMYLAIGIVAIIIAIAIATVLILRKK